MKDANKRKAIFLLFNEEMGVREISRKLHVSTNAVSTIIAQKCEMPELKRKDKIHIDPELLRRLHKRCEGYAQRMHEMLEEEEGIKVGYSTLTRNVLRTWPGTIEKSTL